VTCCDQVGVRFGPGQQERDGAGVKRGILPGGPGEVPGMDGEVGSQLQDILLPGGIAERKVCTVHSRAPGCATTTCACSLDETSNPGQDVAVEPVADLIDRQPFEIGGTQRCPDSK
jgi:hypothetical protein